MNRLPESWRIPLQISLLVVLSLGIVWGIDRSWRRDQAVDDLATGLLEPLLSASPSVESLWSVSSPLQPTRPRPTRTPFPTRDPNVTRPPTVTRAPTVDPKLRLTPVVTPIPLASPPYIPGLADGRTEPYRIAFRKENTIWGMNNDGSELQVLFDAVGQAGLYIRFIPWIGGESAGRWSPSPDGRRLALQLFETAGPPATNRGVPNCLYIYDIATGDLRALVEGGRPTWSPDSRQIAYLMEGLWVIDLASGEQRRIQYAGVDSEASGVVWSPDSTKLTFVFHDAARGGDTELMLAEIGSTISVSNILPASIRGLGSAFWFGGGQELLYSSSEGERGGPQWVPNLWVMHADGSDRVQLTKDFMIQGHSLSPDGLWVALDAIQMYADLNGHHDLWLVSTHNGALFRLTNDYPSEMHLHWSPDGTEIVFQKPEKGIWTMDLRDGMRRQIYPGESGVSHFDVAIMSGSQSLNGAG